MFTVDITAYSGAVRCHECGWGAFALDNLDGWRKARDHEHERHPGTLHASKRYSDQLHRRLTT